MTSKPIIIIGHTRVNLNYVTMYSAANITHEMHRHPGNDYGVHIHLVGSKPLTIECRTKEECLEIVKKLDELCAPLRIDLPETSNKAYD